MSESTYSVLNTAKNKLMDGEDSSAISYYHRAMSENVPAPVIDIHQMTKGYMYLAMTEYSPISYFESLKKLKVAAQGDELCQKEYVVALDTLVNIRDLFLRDVALNYFSEVCTSSWSSNYGRSLNDMYLYLDRYLDDITTGDCYDLTEHKPGADLAKLRKDLMTVEAYCLNMLLMYVAFKSTHYEGKSYYANAMDFGDYALVQVKSHDNYSHNATVMPRLHHISLEAYYDDYHQKLKALEKELGICVPEQLRAQVSRLVDRKDAKNADEKAFYHYAKRMAKEDPGRRSFFNTFGAFNPFYGMIKPILKTCLGAEEVGHFDLDMPFTKKRLLGVCNMLAWANDWSVEMVRTIMFIAGCCFIGVFAYIGLALSMKAGFYLTNLSVEKH